MKISTVSCLLFLAAFILDAQTPGRYVDSVFSVIQTDTNKIYATAPELYLPYLGESYTYNSNLRMHIFQPAGDTLLKRPVLLCMHSGAFVLGTKENDDMLAFCRLFAARGYVTATVQYRLGMNLTSGVTGERAVYRAIQDSRAAVRFLKEFAVNYRIDTNNVYMLGSSAGAFICLHSVFLNKESERPAGTFKINNSPPTLDNGPDLGTLDAIAPSFIHNARPRAIISLWGALKDTLFIETQDSVASVFLAHGTGDNTVLFNYGPPFNYPLFPAAYGSYFVKKRLDNLGLKNESYFVNGAGHEFYGTSNGTWSPAPNAYWDTITKKTTGFLYRIHKPTAAFRYEITNGTVIFTNLSSGSSRWKWNFGNRQTSTLQNPVLTYALPGKYTVSLTAYNEIESWDTVSATVNTAALRADDGKTQSGSAFALSQNYPNPFNPSTTITYQIPYEAEVSLKVYSMLGREVATLSDGIQKAGGYEVSFNAAGFSSGIYLYRLQCGNTVICKKLAVLK